MVRGEGGGGAAAEGGADVRAEDVGAGVLVTGAWATAVVVKEEVRVRAVLAAVGTAMGEMETVALGWEGMGLAVVGRGAEGWVMEAMAMAEGGVMAVVGKGVTG